MDYEEALDYLTQLDTIPYCDQKFADAIVTSQDALRECIQYRAAVAALPDHQGRRNHAPIQTHP